MDPWERITSPLTSKRRRAVLVASKCAMSFASNSIGSRQSTRNVECLYFAALFVLLVSVFFLNCALDGSIASPLHLASELDSPRSAPQDWLLQTKIPMRYRALFSWIVRGTWSSFLPNSGGKGFYATYFFWSFAFFYAAVIALYYLLRMLDFSKLLSFLGCILFLSLPPVMLAYVWPVHTREDPLAYLLVVLGIISVFRSKIIPLLIISVLGGLTRETTLIVPFLYAFYAKESYWKKSLVCIVSVSSIIAVRIMLGYESYDPLGGGTYNVRHLPETIVFLFMTYGVFWIPSLVALYEKWTRRASFNYYWRILVSSTPACLGLIVGTNFLFARVKEIRISFLSFPWIIPMCLCWLRENVFRLKPLVATRHYRVYTTFACLLLYFVIFTLVEFGNLAGHLGAFYLQRWRLVGYIHMVLTVVIVVPLLLKRGTFRKSMLEGS